MRIVILGANGQVAAEVAQRLAGTPGVDLVPVSRTRGGSAHLRSHGIAVWHGSVSDDASAKAMLKNADVVANFALAGGMGRTAIEANNRIIQATIDHSEPTARIIFISTLAVEGSADAAGLMKRGAYGDLKRRNELHFEQAARRAGRRGWTLRLGHVCGEEQNITQSLRRQIALGPVRAPDLERLSNTTYIEAIAEALLAVGEDRAGPPGRYDLVNYPQWTWREVFEHEARVVGLPVEFETSPAPPPHPPALSARLMGAAFALIQRLGLRAVLERSLAFLPGGFADQTKADYFVSRARAEIAALAPRREVPALALLWPAVDARHLPGVRETQTLIAEGAFRGDRGRTPWPADLGPIPGRQPDA